MELFTHRLPSCVSSSPQSFEDWAQEGRSCALSGGATALIFLPALRAAKVDWSKITLFWTDERAVPADDPESNYGIADRMLLSPLGARAPRAIRMPADLPRLDDAAAQYDEVLSTELRGGVLDLALLGVGEDGHVASLFPGTPGARPEQPARRGCRGRPASAEAATLVDVQVCAADAKDLVNRRWTEEAAGVAGRAIENPTLDAVGSAAASGERRHRVH